MDDKSETLNQRIVEAIKKLSRLVVIPSLFILTSFLLMGCGGDATLIDRIQAPLSYGIFGILILFLGISAVIELVNSKRNTMDKVVWIFIVIFFPIGGYIIYRLFGHSTTKRKSY